MSDPGPVPVHAYPAKHRGEPRRCAACGMPETEATELHGQLHAFYDERADVGKVFPRRYLRGRHKANTPTLEGP